MSVGPGEVKPADGIAWGKEVDGLQAGLNISNPVRIGEKAKAVVKLRNVGRETIKVSAWPLSYHSPRVVDAAGKQVSATRPPEPSFEIIPTNLTLKPGQTVDLDKADIVVAEDDIRRPVKGPEPVVDTFTIHVQPGKYKADVAGFLKDRPTLATGAVEFEVKEAAARHRFTVLLTKTEPWPRTSRCAFLDNDRILVQPGTSEGLEVQDAKSGKLAGVIIPLTQGTDRRSNMIKLEPIGHVRSSRSALADDKWGSVTARIELVGSLSAEALDGIEAFSHAEVIYFFDRAPEEADCLPRAIRRPLCRLGRTRPLCRG